MHIIYVDDEEEMVKYYHGYYLMEYSWAEETNAWLNRLILS